jgi:hypothetical protein
MLSPKSGVRGYAFLVVMMMATILLISLTAALPSIYAEGQREKEAELIFRGNQYARAILFFHRQFGRFPNSEKELLKKTNGIRFLRHAFTDPMTLSGKWRYIHANAAGMVIDSKTQPMLGGPGARTNPQNPMNPQSAQGSQFTLGPSTGQNPGNSGTSSTSDSTSTAGKEGDSSGLTNQMSGAFIVGVASTSKKSSFRTLDNHTHYDEWEFLGIDQLAGGVVGPGGTGTTPGQSTTPPSQTPGQNPGQGTNPTTPVTPPPTAPPNTPDDDQ